MLCAYGSRRAHNDRKQLKAAQGAIVFCLIQLLAASSAFAQTAVPGPRSGSVSTYGIDGFALGARLDAESPFYRTYQCGRSDQFSEFTRCQRTQQENGYRR